MTEGKAYQKSLIILQKPFQDMNRFNYSEIDMDWYILSTVWM